MPLYSAASPQAPWTPSDAGFLAWNFDPGIETQGATTLTNNTITLLRVNIRQAISVTNVVTYVTTQGSGLTSGQNFAGLYDSSGNQIAVTADQTTPWGSGGAKTMALASGPFSLSAGTFVWVALLPNESAGATPTLLRGPTTSGSGQNVGFTVSTARAATNTTGTSLPSSITPASNTLIGAVFWVALS